jgi:hypothetical protein
MRRRRNRSFQQQLEEDDSPGRIPGVGRRVRRRAGAAAMTEAGQAEFRRRLDEQHRGFSTPDRFRRIFSETFESVRREEQEILSGQRSGWSSRRGSRGLPSLDSERDERESRSQARSQGRRQRMRGGRF